MNDFTVLNFSLAYISLVISATISRILWGVQGLILSVAIDAVITAARKYVKCGTKRDKHCFIFITHCCLCLALAGALIHVFSVVILLTLYFTGNCPNLTEMEG